jgi:hypothetical protein
MLKIVTGRSFISVIGIAVAAVVFLVGSLQAIEQYPACMDCDCFIVQCDTQCGGSVDWTAYDCFSPGPGDSVGGTCQCG